jgi:hypothetical protein
MCEPSLHLASACVNRGAGAFACQPRTRPGPLPGLPCQAGVNRIVLDIPCNPLQFRFIPHAMVEGFVLPESFAGSTQNQVGLPRRGAFQPARNHRQRRAGTQQYMNVIGHDHPRPGLVELPSTFDVQEDVGHHLRYASIPQPNGADSGLVHLPVQGEECAAGGESMRQPALGHRAGQTPRQEQEGRLGDIGMPVGKSSAVEHVRLVGESACPTSHMVPGRLRNSQQNGETGAVYA